MKTIILKKIKIEGFYGQTRSVDFSPTETVIRGDVKLGKTTILNAFTWCLLGVDLEGRANYMLYDQSVEYSREFAGQARVEVTIDIDGQESTIIRTAKQKWVRDKNADTWVKASSDEYKYFIDDLELTKGEFDTWIENSICPLRRLAVIANIDQWRRYQWRTLREMFQSIVGEISSEDFSHDYSSVIPVIESIGIEKARQEFQARGTKYDKTLERLKIEEEATKRNLVGNEEINEAEKRIKEINEEIDEIDRRQTTLTTENAEVIAKREEMSKTIAAKEHALRDESEAYSNAHTEKLRKLRDEYNDVLTTNRRNEQIRKTSAQGIDTAKQRLADLELQLKTLRARYKEANTKLFDGICPTCGSRLSGVPASDAAKSFQKQKDEILKGIKSQGDYVNMQITQCKTDIAQYERNVADIVDGDEKAAMKAYQSAEKAFIQFVETERGKQILSEITELQNIIPQVTWANDIEELLQRKGELRIELKKQHEIYGQKLSNERVLEQLESIERERTSTVQAQVANAKTARLISDYERELAAIIRFRANKLFPDRTEVVMSKYKKNGDIDFDVCQILINGKDATATNTADRMNAGIDISTVFMRDCDIIFPLFVDGAESNTAIENYGRQIIKTVVDETCKQITIDKK